jgi:hypothetical protein
MLASGSASRPPLTAHWFLPIYGDSRYLLGGGHGVLLRRRGLRHPPTSGINEAQPAAVPFARVR